MAFVPHNVIGIIPSFRLYFVIITNVLELLINEAPGECYETMKTLFTICSWLLFPQTHDPD